MDKQKLLEQLQSKILQCRICRDKFGFEPRPYVWGKANAKIVQISQAPSLSVHRTGKPFNDISGKILRSWYGIDEQTFYDKSKFYITSISHCYPGKDKNGNDRKPPLICAKKWLMKELELIDNELFIVIGSYAAKFFFPQQKLTQLVFEEGLKILGKPAIVLPHPSPSNFRWFDANKDFEVKILPKLRGILQNILSN